MIPNIHQSIEEIIKASTPEEKIIWQQVRLLTGENASIQQIHFMGAIAGTEFLTYTAGKIYLASKIYIGSSQNNLVNINPATVYFYDFSNAVSHFQHSNNAMWDATAAAPRYSGSAIELSNIYFSRLVVQIYSNIIFTGYKIVS